MLSLFAVRRDLANDTAEPGHELFDASCDPGLDLVALAVWGKARHGWQDASQRHATRRHYAGVHALVNELVSGGLAEALLSDDSRLFIIALLFSVGCPCVPDF